MDPVELLDIFTREQRINITFPDNRREASGQIIRHVPLNGCRGFVIYADLDTDCADQAIQEQKHYFQRLGLDLEWKLYDYDRPADLLKRLQRFGFEIEDPEALMVLDLADHPELINQPVSQSIHKVETLAEIDELIQIEDEVWQEDHHDLGEHLKLDLSLYPDSLSIYLAYLDDHPVSGAWVYYHPGTQFASLWGGSTLEEYRQRGLYSGLLAVRAREAWQRGFRFLTVDASPMSRPILERRGFQLLTFSRPCVFRKQG